MYVTAVGRAQLLGVRGDQPAGRPGGPHQAAQPRGWRVPVRRVWPLTLTLTTLTLNLTLALTLTLTDPDH